MELKQAVKYLKNIKDADLRIVSHIVFLEAMETVLQALEKLQNQCKEMIKEKQEFTSALLDSIPKKKIEDIIKTFSEENEVITQEEYYARNYIRKFLEKLLEE